MIKELWKDAEIIIFCQAPADLIYVLDIIEQLKNQKKMLITRNTKSLYFFLLKLKLKNTRIIHLENLTLNLRSLKSIVINKKLIRKSVAQFDIFRDNEVYFFSTSYDYYTAAIVAKLTQKNRVHYYNHYDNLTSKVGKKSFSIGRFIKAKLFQYITSGVKFSYYQSRNFPQFKYFLYPIKKHVINEKPVVDKKFLHSIETHPNVLFLISEKEIKGLAPNEIEKIHNLINYLKKRYNIYYKGHPRLGSSKKVSSWADETISDIIPSEFIDYEKFEYVIGIGSAALCYPAEKNYSIVISLLKHIKILNHSTNDDLIDYLTEYSENGIDFEDSELFEVIS